MINFLTIYDKLFRLNGYEMTGYAYANGFRYISSAGKTRIFAVDATLSQSCSNLL